MLASLSVRDIVLIERADVSFAAGLNVLTGETGAGKSILLDALGLAAGERGGGRASLRPGAKQGTATAVFDVGDSHPTHRLLAEQGLRGEGQDREIILRRVIAADGRTRAFVNDQPVGLPLAREAGSALLEVHGQADDRGLFDSATHRVLLDAFGAHTALAADVSALHARCAAAERRLADIRRAAENATSERDYLRHAAAELGDLAPETGEEERLAAERAFLMNAGRLAEDIAAAYTLVCGEGGAETTLGGALRRLSRMSSEGRQAAAAAESALDSALVLLQEGGQELQALLRRLDAEPGRLERLEERLFALRAAARKHHVAPDALSALREEFEAKLAMLDLGEAGIAAAATAATEARSAFLTRARALSAARANAAKALEMAVAKELGPLKLGHARFRVALTPLADEEAGAGGLERVAFEIATLENAPFGPLARIASGGELARFALALKVALAEASPPAALVFDEVDRGVGGAVADAVGERLQRLSRTTQVLLVTHSPQVAARADRHFRISRHGDATRIEHLPDEARVEEIARMLSGAAVTEEARAAAVRLLAEARGSTSPRTRKKARA